MKIKSILIELEDGTKTEKYLIDNFSEFQSLELNCYGYTIKRLDITEDKLTKDKFNLNCSLCNCYMCNDICDNCEDCNGDRTSTEHKIRNENWIENCINYKN